MFSSIQKNKLKLNAIPTKLTGAELDSITQPKASGKIYIIFKAFAVSLLSYVTASLQLNSGDLKHT